PEPDPGFLPEGTEVLSGTPDDGPAGGFTPPNGDASGRSFDDGFGADPRAEAAGQGTAHAALDLGADDLLPVELAPLELAAPRDKTDRTPLREAGAPVSTLISDEATMSM